MADARQLDRDKIRGHQEGAATLSGRDNPAFDSEVQKALGDRPRSLHPMAAPKSTIKGSGNGNGSKFIGPSQ